MCYNVFIAIKICIRSCVFFGIVDSKNSYSTDIRNTFIFYDKESVINDKVPYLFLHFGITIFFVTLFQL